MSRESRAVGHDDMIAQMAIVSNVTVCHKKVVVADSRNAASANRTAVQSHNLSHHVAIADPQ